MHLALSNAEENNAVCSFVKSIYLCVFLVKCISLSVFMYVYFSVCISLFVFLFAKCKVLFLNQKEQFLATLVALHFTPAVSRSHAGSEFQTSIACELIHPK